MKLTQIRNATIVLAFNGRKVIVDPMLARKSALPKLRYFRSSRKNPLVELPRVFEKISHTVKYALITHCQKGHFDHLDRTGARWLRENEITTFCTPHDASYLTKKHISTRVLDKKLSAFFNGTIEQVPATHTTGWLTPFMEHGTGYFIQLPEEPSIYLMGDTILTNEIRHFITERQPDYIIAPTGKAQLDIGAPLLLNEREIVELASLTKGRIICNHMDALDHCRITRHDLGRILEGDKFGSRYLIPEDGETIHLY